MQFVLVFNWILKKAIGDKIEPNSWFRYQTGQSRKNCRKQQYRDKINQF